MSNGGFVKIWRNIFDEQDFRQMPSSCSLFLNLIARANWIDGKARFKGAYRTIERGQLITGRKKLAEQTGLSESTVYRALEHLQNSQRITVESDKQGTLITICNYNKYQDNPKKGEQQTHNTRTESETTSRTTSDTANDTTDDTHQIRREEEKKERRKETQGSPPASQSDESAPLQGSLLGDVENEAPKDKESPEDRKARIDLAQWKQGCWNLCKSMFIESGGNPNDFPRLDGRVSGMLTTQIKRLGSTSQGEYQIRLGVQKIAAAIVESAERYQKNQSDFWYPTLNSILNTNKLGQLLKGITDEQLSQEVSYTGQGWKELTQEILRDAENKRNAQANQQVH